MMEKSVLVGNIKTYASKKGRTSNYRLSCIDFKQEAVFDKLLEDEVNKKPISNKKSYVEKGVVNYTKSYSYCSTSKALKNIGNQLHTTRKHSLLPRTKKKKVRTKNLQRNKENSKYCSLLYKSNNSDLDYELPGLSAYEIGSKLDPLADYKKRQALRSTQLQPKSRCPSTTKNNNVNSDLDYELSGLSAYEMDSKLDPLADYKKRQALRSTQLQPKLRCPSTTKNNNVNSCISRNESTPSKVPVTNINHSTSSIDKPDPTPVKSDEKVFKKPIVFVERSSDLFYKNSITKSRGQTKTRKKLSFVSNTFNTEYGSNNSFENANELCRTVQSNVDELFNSDSETQNENRCSVVFDPGTASTPNFDRKIRFGNYEMNKTENEDRLKQLEDTFSFIHLFSDQEQSRAIISQSPKRSPVIRNEDTSKKESSDPSIHTTINESLHISKNDKFEKTSKRLNYSSNSYAGCSRNNDTDKEHSENLSDSRSGSSSDSNSSSFTSNSDTDDEESKPGIILENNSPIKSRDGDLHISLFTFLGEPKPEENFSETSSDSNIYKQQESVESIRQSSENDSLSTCSECEHSPSAQISFSSCAISENDSLSDFGERQNFSRVQIQTSFSSSPISINRIFEENYGMNDLEDQQSNLKTEPLHVTVTEPDLEENSSLSKKITCSTEDIIDNLLLMSITAEPEVKETSSIVTIEFLSPIRASTEPKVEKFSLMEASELLSPIRAPTEPVVEEHSLNETSLSLIQTSTKNISESDQFVGWPTEECHQALKLKETIETICKELEPKYVPPEDEIPAHLKLVTTRRKKTFIMPTLNEENSNLEEDEEVDLNSKARNSPVHNQDLQLGFHNQTSLCTSRVLERSSMLVHSLVLAAGKKWRRSFITLKNIREYGFQSQTEHEDLKGRCWRKNIEELISNQLDENSDLKEIAEISTRTYSNETFLNQNCTYLEKCKRPSKARFSLCVNHKSPPPQQQQQTSESSGLTSSSDSSKLLGDKSYCSFVGSEQDSRIENNYDLEAGDYSRSHKVSLECHDIRDHLSAKETVLRYCKQTEPLPFEECFNDRLLKNCKKIGEGVYGEVFMLKRNQAHCSVLKIIPIEGDLLINGEKQKKYEEIVSELVISRELSDLRKRKDYFTDNFAELQKCWCVYGKYPNRLIDLWDVYNDKKGSDNDSPKVFDENQLYIVLELSHGGEDIESFVFNNAQQTLSVFTQVAYALAVAEQAFNFEHRDLHWGNILVSKSKKERTKYIIGDFESTVRLRGVKVTIIDYTLSRITVNNCIVFNDIGQDPELFTAQGDFQFEVYRLMKHEVREIWNQFKPKTNVYWLCYLLDKMIKEVRYRRVSTQIHQTNLDRLNEFFELILGFASCHELVCHSYFKRTTSATK